MKSNFEYMTKTTVFGPSRSKYQQILKYIHVNIQELAFQFPDSMFTKKIFLCKILSTPTKVGQKESVMKMKTK
jgi:hypothetical protein